MRTVALNLTQKISVISCPLRQPLPPERSLRSAHRLSAESRRKAKTAGDQWSPLRSGRSASKFVGAGIARPTIPPSASPTPPFTQGRLYPPRRGQGAMREDVLIYHCIAVTNSGKSSAQRPSSADGGSGFSPRPHSSVNAGRWNRCRNQSLKPALADSAGTSSIS